MLASPSRPASIPLTHVFLQRVAHEVVFAVRNSFMAGEHPSAHFDIGVIAHERVSYGRCIPSCAGMSW